LDRAAQSGYHAYYAFDQEPFDFLEKPTRHPHRPLWAGLESDSKKKAAIYMDLAKEAIIAEPLLFLYCGFQRIVASADPAEFKVNRFLSATYPIRFENDFARAEKRGSPIRRLFGIGKGEPLPPLLRG
jgi:hypothetical protein